MANKLNGVSNQSLESRLQGATPLIIFDRLQSVVVVARELRHPIGPRCNARKRIHARKCHYNVPIDLTLEGVEPSPSRPVYHQTKPSGTA